MAETLVKKRVLVCGATGFIGRNVTEALAPREGLDVHAVRFTSSAYDCANVTWRQADLRLESDVARLVDGIDVVIQAAATTSGAKDIVTRPFIHVTDNAVMNSLLFRAAHEKKVGHIIFFSCTVMYPSSDRPLGEADFNANAPLHPRYFGVGWTKIYVEKMCEFYASLGVTRYTAIRHSNIYGPHDKFDLERSHVFGATVTKVMTADDGKITVWGSGEEERDLLYVDDLVDFVTAAMDRQDASFGLYNCGAGKSVAIKDLVAKIVDGSGQRLRIEHDLSQPTIKTTLSVDCGKAKEELGWEPRILLEDGIARTIAWWRQNPPA